MSAAELGSRGPILMLSTDFDPCFEPTSPPPVTDDEARPPPGILMLSTPVPDARIILFSSYWDRMEAAVLEMTGTGALGALELPPAAWRRAIGATPLTGWQVPVPPPDYVRRLHDRLLASMGIDIQWLAAALAPPSTKDTERKTDGRGRHDLLIVDDIPAAAPRITDKTPDRPTTPAEAAAIVRAHLAARHAETEAFLRHVRLAALAYRTPRWPRLTSI